jgi:predicted RNA-binding Zn ribbon-like protein
VTAAITGSARVVISEPATEMVSAVQSLGKSVGNASRRCIPYPCNGSRWLSHLTTNRAYVSKINAMQAEDTRMNKRTRHQGRAPNLPRLLGGRLCLDFANTIEGPISAQPHDFLGAYADLAHWSWHARVVDEAELRRLLDLAEAAPARAREVFANALGLRGSVDRIFRAIAADAEPLGKDLRTVQGEYCEALSTARLAAAGKRFEWTWPATDDLRFPLWAAAESAIRLLIQGDLGRIKQCPGANDCGWLFYDTSRNGARRWCSMEGCGSRVKMRRHYARLKADAQSASPDR